MCGSGRVTGSNPVIVKQVLNRALETEREKVLPFYESTLETEEAAKAPRGITNGPVIRVPWPLYCRIVHTTVFILRFR